jgi:holo-[acyl-carrier protein] synthase
LQCHGGALARLQALTPPGMAARIDLSMTDEPPYAQAFIVISTTVLP